MSVLCESHPAFAAHDREGQAEAAFCVVRPPGHHATPSRAMAVCAAILAAEGERVVIRDWDAHHGNGTQDAFWNDPRVLYVSLHQWPLYPGTGRLTETGEGRGGGLTVNLTLPSAGDYADLGRRSAALAPGGRCVAFLEGGYDLVALKGSVAARVGALAGVDHRPEPATTGGPGAEVVAVAARLRA